MALLAARPRGGPARGSHLPGPRANLELLDAAGDVLARDEALALAGLASGNGARRDGPASTCRAAGWWRWAALVAEARDGAGGPAAGGVEPTHAGACVSRLAIHEIARTPPADRRSRGAGVHAAEGWAAAAPVRVAGPCPLSPGAAPSPRRSSSRSGGAASAPSTPDLAARAAVATVSPQPGGASPGARSASGASTNSRFRASTCGHHERQRGLRRVLAPARRRPLDVDPVAPEHEQVEVDLARAPALARLPPERPLQALERDEQRRGAGRRVGAGRHVERDAPRCGTRAGRRRRRARWRTAARRRAAATPGQGGERRGPRRRASRRRRRRSPRARRTPAPAPRPATSRSLDSGGCRPSPCSSSPRPPAADAGPLERRLEAAWSALAEHHRRGFLAAGADEVVDPPRAARRYPIRSRAPAAGRGAGPPGGLVVLGPARSPWRRPRDRRGLRRRRPPPTRPGALANQRHSADVVAIAARRETAPRPARRPPLRQRAAALARRGAPGSRSATSAPGAGWRWTSTRRWTCCSSRGPPGRRALPHARRPDADAARARDGSRALRALAGDPGAELLVAGRTSAADLPLGGAPHAVADPRRWSRSAACGRRPIGDDARARRTAGPPRSVLGLLLDRDGPGSLGRAPRRRSATARWSTAASCSPTATARTSAAGRRAEDRFASDLLLAGPGPRPVARRSSPRPRRAPRSRCCSAAHTLVGPGLRLALGGAPPAVGG